jgi:transposase
MFLSHGIMRGELLVADGVANTVIAERLDVHVDVVSRWRKRFCEKG